MSTRETYLEQPCIEWQGSRMKAGYGQKMVARVNYYAHRLAFEKAWGLKIPQGMVVMHTCDNPPCVNPLHLQLGTQKDNLQDMAAKGRGANQNTLKTYCINGHEFTPENTWTNGRRRHCRTCHRERQRGYRA